MNVPRTKSGSEVVRALRVMDWADLHGNELADRLRLDVDDDGDDLAVVNDALLASGDAYYALQRLESLEAERDALREALARIEALRTNEHAAGFDEAREIAAAALERPE